jgi:glycosyltransferase involved in cell wall biosynthesis
VHTRAPSHPAFIAILISFILQKKIWWHKFAGSWDAASLPIFYKIQKNILQNASQTKVAINGFWDNQPKHCLSFENPCLDENDIFVGKKIATKKSFKKPFTFVFVGRLEPAKGMDRIIAALKEIPNQSIDKIHFIGNGNRIDFYKSMCQFLGEKVIFHGFLNKEGVHKILQQSHFILLPSDSEGFPKVVAEAACYGTIPIVSNVGSIPHYINGSNGFVWDIKGAVSFSEYITSVIDSSENDLQKIKENSLFLAEKFTFANYNNKLQAQILSLHEND